jgi:hypothetical protein
VADPDPEFGSCEREGKAAILPFLPLQGIKNESSSTIIILIIIKIFIINLLA